MIEKIKGFIEAKIKPSVVKCRELIDRLLDFIKNNKKTVSIVAASVFAVAAAVILTCVYFSGDADKSKDADESGWGSGVTEGIPRFSGNADSLDMDEDYAAAYYSNVSGEQVEEYISKLNEKCGLQFEGSGYPRTAVLDDKIIALHYNVTEMRFSVTVALLQD